MPVRDTREQGVAALVAVALMLVLTPVITVATSLPAGLSGAPVRFQFEGMMAGSLAPAVLGLALLVYGPGSRGPLWKWVVGLLSLLLVLVIVPLVVDFLLSALELRGEVAPAVRGNLDRALVRSLSIYALVGCALALLAREALTGARALSRRTRQQARAALLYRSAPMDGQSAEA